MIVRLPQVRDFDRIRHFLRLVAAKESDLQRIGVALGAGAKYAKRHAAYYAEASVVLDLFEEKRWRLTARGRAHQ